MWTFKEREKEYEIRKNLENYLENYDDFNYVSKNITLYKDKKLERILIILLKRSIIEQIIEDCTLDNIVIEGIYPLFFMEIFNSQRSNNYKYIENYEDNFYIFSFKNGSLEDLKKLELSTEELMDDSKYIKDFFISDEKMLTYITRRNKEIYSKFNYISQYDWRKYTLFYKKEIDFLPHEYRKNIEEKKFYKLLGIIVFIVLIIILSIFILLNIYIDKKMEVFYLKQVEMKKIQEKIVNKKEKIVLMQEQMKSIKKSDEYRKNRNINEWLEKATNLKSLIKVKKIEYIGNNKLYIEGISSSQNSYYKFQDYLMNSDHFKKLNQDFLKKSGGGFEFRIEVMLWVIWMLLNWKNIKNL